MTGVGVTALGMAPVLNTPLAKAQDMSNGANDGGERLDPQLKWADTISVHSG